MRIIMSTKFFNNGLGNTLFDKLKGIASEMATFDRFLAVVGFFRSSGYFKLRKELGDISEIKILIGINIDDIKIIIRLTSIFFGFFNESSFAITEPPAFCTIMHGFILYILTH